MTPLPRYGSIYLHTASHIPKVTDTMQAIKTTYHGPKNTLGSKIIAQAGARTTRMLYRHALSPADNHIAAARLLIDALNWHEVTGYQGIASGELAGGSYAHVLVLSYEVRK